MQCYFYVLIDFLKQLGSRSLGQNQNDDAPLVTGGLGQSPRIILKNTKFSL